MLLIVIFLFHYSFCTVCSSLGQTLIAESSTIKTLTSPNYPSDYDSDTICSWTIETHQLSDYVVEVTFDDFRLESDNLQHCSSDYLAVYDGSDAIGTFCGFIGPGSKVFSTGRHLTLRFVTDTAFNYRGFKLSYFAVPAGRLNALLMYILAGTVAVSDTIPT